MSEDQTTEQPQGRRRGGAVGFTVELGDNYGSYISIANIGQGELFRGRWSNAALAQRVRADGEPIGSRPLGELATMPDIPGIHISVDMTNRALRIFDPLDENEELLKTASKILTKGLNVGDAGEVGPWPERHMTFEKDEFKTLLREFLRHEDGGTLAVTSGRLPTMEEIDAMPGDYIYDPCNSGQDHPRYEKDVPAWRDRLAYT